MPIQPNGNAPYAPPSTVLSLINRYRDRGLSKPFEPEVLMRAGVAESLVPRTLQALKLLDLIDEGGSPTEALDDLARASADEFLPLLAMVVRSAYADVFQYADPASDDPQRIRDAFRSYNPRGQQERMVSLFMQLCKAAEIIEEIPRNPSGPKRNDSRAVRASSSKNGSKGRSQSRRGPQESREVEAETRTLPLLAGLLAELPEPETPLTEAERQRFRNLFGTVLDFYFPVPTVLDSSGGEENRVDASEDDPESLEG